MLCPHCDKPLKEVYVFAEARHTIAIRGEYDGKPLLDLEDSEETPADLEYNADWTQHPFIDIECRECGKNINDIFSQGLFN